MSETLNQITTSGFNRRILVVDDNQAIHEDFRKVFGASVENKLAGVETVLFGDVAAPQAGFSFELEFASQGQEALERVNRALQEGRPFAMAFMDVRMPPGWDGIETISKLWEVDPQLQVAICTAYSDYSLTEIAKRLRNSSSFVILKKPFDTIEVLQLANAFTEKWNLSAGMRERTRRLQESEERYRFLAEAVPGIVWTARPDGSVDYGNRRVQEYAGRTLEQIRDWGWKDVLHPDDAPRTLARWNRSLQTGEAYEIEYRLKRAADGAWRWHLARALPLRNAEGRIVQWIGTATDIDDQKRAAEVLRESQAGLEKRVVERTEELASARVRFEHLLRSSPAIIYSRKAEGRGEVTFISQTVATVLGHEPAEFLENAELWPQRIHAEDAGVFREHRFQLLVRERHSAEYRWQHKDGSYRWLHDEARVIRDGPGAPFEIIGSCTDITERKQMEAALRQAKDELERRVAERTAELQAAVLKTRRVLEELAHQKFALDQHAIVVVTDAQGRITYANNRFCAISKYGREELMGQDHRILNSGFHPREFFAEMYRAISKGQVWHGDICNRAKDGSLFWLNTTIVPFLGAGGKPQQYIAIRTDITALKQAEIEISKLNAGLEQRVHERTEELAAARAKLQTVLDGATQVSIIATDPSGLITVFNRGAERMLGYTAAEMVGRQPGVFHLESEVAARAREMAERSGRTITANDVFIEAALQGKHEEREWTQVRKDGSHLTVSLTITALRDEQGELSGFVGVANDITRRKRDEQNLAYERDLLRTLMVHSPDYIYFKDLNSKFLRCSSTLAAKFGCNRIEDVIGKSDFDFYGEEHARPAFEDEQEIIRTGKPLVGKVEQEIMKGSGQVTWALTNKMPLRNKAGEIIGTFGISKDITALKVAENDRQMMELQLRQAQKLEAVGQLAAGIAHEINTPTQYVGDNTRFLKDSFESIAKALQAYEPLLNAVKSNTVTPELVARLEESLAASDLKYLFEQVPAAIHETLEGVDRVAKIVRAMKEFSHPGGKEKTAVDLNKAIETTATVARNEWKYVADLTLDLDPSLPAVPCFLGEFNQCILNLLVNASHAIGDVVKQNPGAKGTITVRTRRDGDHVEIRVSDTGTGIPEANRARIFEPFFTTKDVGKGTGQGLSMVYGSIVKKHSGTVNFETEVGKGTTFILRLPISPPADSRARTREESVSAPFSTEFRTDMNPQQSAPPTA